MVRFNPQFSLFCRCCFVSFVCNILKPFHSKHFQSISYRKYILLLCGNFVFGFVFRFCFFFNGMVWKYIKVLVGKLGIAKQVHLTAVLEER